MFEYKIDVMEKLKEKGYSIKELRAAPYNIGGSQFDKIRRGEIVGINVLEKLCALLDLQPGSIIKYIPDEKRHGATSEPDTLTR